jgi:hypothetical protein
LSETQRSPCWQADFVSDRSTMFVSSFKPLCLSRRGPWPER